jgi:hypothetical protein
MHDRRDTRCMNFASAVSVHLRSALYYVQFELHTLTQDWHGFMIFMLCLSSNFRFQRSVYCTPHMLEFMQFINEVFVMIM